MTALIRIDRSWPGAEGKRAKPIRFCTRCGHPDDPLDRGADGQAVAEPPKRRITGERICRRCEMGLMLSCSRDALPGAAASFLIVTFELLVSAVSQEGEKLFGREQGVVGRPVLELLTSPMGDDQLARHVGMASQRSSEPYVMPVRLLSAKARKVGTMAARIATCGPPRAALVTVEPSEFGRR